MRNILVPTDLSIRSLGVIHNAVAHFDKEPLRVVLMHTLHMPGSILDLMMLSRRSSHYKLVTDDFRDACEIIRNKYASNIQKLEITFMLGNTVSLLRNHLDFHEIDTIVCPETDDFTMPSKESFNPATLIRKSKHEVLYLPVKKREQVFPTATLSELFLANT